MLGRKSLIFFAVVVAIAMLFAAADTMAQQGLPDECVVEAGRDGTHYFSILPNEDGVWPIPSTDDPNSDYPCRDTDTIIGNESCTAFPYLCTGPKCGGITAMHVLLPGTANCSNPFTINSMPPGGTFYPPCSDGAFKIVCDGFALQINSDSYAGDSHA